MISPCGTNLSVDSLLKQKKYQKIPIWSIRLMQLQLAIVYFFAGTTKFGTETWMNGTAVNYILRNNLFNRFSMEWIVAIPIFISLVTWFSLAFELTFPFLIWFDKMRKYLLIVGILLHTGIFIFIDIGWFSLIILACYIVFLKSQEAEAIKLWFLKLYSFL
jgi:hypothetical protein